MKRHFLPYLLVLCLAGCTQRPAVKQWVSTTPEAAWQVLAVDLAADTSDLTIVIDPARTAQTVDGFGICFTEMGWHALNILEPARRDSVLRDLFSPGVGANFTLCRTPIGANNYSTDYYSYDDTEGDFDLKNFSIAHDRVNLIPYIHAAQRFNPGLRLYATPWCPPTWMKRNKHFACLSNQSMERIILDLVGIKNAREQDILDRIVQNGLDAADEVAEGTDGFIMKEPYLEAYARYFAKYVEAYRREGINIFAVMPQNSFCSAQIFPSCTWSLQGLTTFMGQYLGPAMQEQGVELMYGTLAGRDSASVDAILADSACRNYIHTLGFQWGGIDALHYASAAYPDLKFYQTEHETSDGLNTWQSAIHSWDTLLDYFRHGASAYTYYNAAAQPGGINRWGLPSNSLLTVDDSRRTASYNPDYYVIRHVSHYVQPGAQRIELGGTYTEALGFLNPDHTLAVVLANKGDTPRPVSIRLGDQTVTPTLPAHSFNTLLFEHI